ncbi:MAG: hypothetical protein Q7R33_00855 [Nitrosarchaeum sp.]|nr:hypothetical protein [Nitrosarchaeum sp.]
MNVTKYRTTLYKKMYPDCPDEILAILLSSNEFMTIEEANKFTGYNVKSKRLVKSNCEICHEDFTIGLTKWLTRKYKVSVCRKCYVPKFVTKQQDWLEVNSVAQFEAQNRPEVKEKMRQSIKQMWHDNPEIKERMRQKIIEKFETESYRDAVLGSDNKGFVITRFGRLRFDSLGELSFLIKCDKDQSVTSLTRWDKHGIPYFNGQEKRYYPDFILNNDTIIDVKSGFVRSKDDNLEKKIEATRSQYEHMTFKLLGESEITKLKFKTLRKLGYDIQFSHKYKQLLYESGMKSATKFQKQITLQSNFTKLKSKKIFHYKGQVHDLNVSTPDKSYIVNNVVVHNSAAGSLVCYLLDITNIDPIKHTLLFERFLSLSRSMAIFDLSIPDAKFDPVIVPEIKITDEIENWHKNDRIVRLEE